VHRNVPPSSAISDGEPRETELYLHHKDCYRVPVSIRVSPLRDKNNHIIGGIELFTDISSQAANALRGKELEKLALIDHFTQLANRYYIEKEIKSLFEKKKRFNISFVILLLDIDYFKKFNETIDSLIERVESLLYIFKSAGRNRLTID
jgi:predicted signal transduction protein with EAL and GGDEF domain